MVSVNDQWNAFFSAPLPFGLALLAVSIVVWGIFEWAYRAIINKTRTLYDLSIQEAKHAQEIASRKEAELRETTTELSEQFEKLKEQIGKQKEVVSAEVESTLDKITQTAKTANSQIRILSSANNAIAAALDGWPGYRRAAVGPLWYYDVGFRPGDLARLKPHSKFWPELQGVSLRVIGVQEPTTNSGHKIWVETPTGERKPELPVEEFEFVARRE
jgi:hypothetical protein